MLGLPYPGGVEIDRLAGEGDASSIAFPRPLKGKENIDFSFSGLKTAVKLHHDNLVQSGLDVPLADIAASFQEAVVDVLLRKTFVAAQMKGIRDVVISGGVAANSRLRSQLVERAGQAGLRGHLTRPILCTDNAAMIAGAGRFNAPLGKAEKLTVEPFASGQLV